MSRLSDAKEMIGACIGAILEIRLPRDWSVSELKRYSDEAMSVVKLLAEAKTEIEKEQHEQTKKEN